MQQQFVVQRLAVTALPLAAAVAELVGFAVVAAAVGVQLVQLWWELGPSTDDASPPQSPPPVAPAVVTQHQWLQADDSSLAAVTSFLQ